MILYHRLSGASGVLQLSEPRTHMPHDVVDDVQRPGHVPTPPSAQQHMAGKKIR